MVTIRSVAGTSLSRARNSVVLPDPVPPAITTLRLARTIAASSDCTPWSYTSRVRSSSSDDSSKR